MKIKKLLFLILGCLCLGLGCIGIVLPILPTVPFFLVTVICFANSSQKLHDWFIHTKMYQKHLESFVRDDCADKGRYYYQRNAAYGLWIYHNAAERNIYSLYDTCFCMAQPYCLLCIWCKNNNNRKGRGTFADVMKNEKHFSHRWKVKVSFD